MRGALLILLLPSLLLAAVNRHLITFSEGTSGQNITMSVFANGIVGTGPFHCFTSTGGQAVASFPAGFVYYTNQEPLNGALSIGGQYYYATTGMAYAQSTEKAYNIRLVPGNHPTNFAFWAIVRVEVPEVDTPFAFDWATAFYNIASDFINPQFTMIDNAMRFTLELAGQAGYQQAHRSVDYTVAGGRYLGTNYAWLATLNTNFIFGVTSAVANVNTFSNQSIGLHSMAGTPAAQGSIIIRAVYLDASDTADIEWPPRYLIPKPPAPSLSLIRLGATAADNGIIAAQWTACAGATGYMVQRSTQSGSGFVDIIGVGASVLAYTNAGLNVGTDYYFKVVATNEPFATESSEQSKAPAFVYNDIAPTRLRLRL